MPQSISFLNGKLRWIHSRFCQALEIEYVKSQPFLQLNSIPLLVVYIFILSFEMFDMTNKPLLLYVISFGWPVGRFWNRSYFLFKNVCGYYKYFDIGNVPLSLYMCSVFQYFSSISFCIKVWVCLFVCLRFFVPLEKFSLIGRRHKFRRKGCKFWPMLGTFGHWAVMVL